MDTSINLSDLHLYEQNPRQITDDMRARLASSLEEFGDLSGIVRNVREGAESCGRLLGGNQRTRIFQAHGEECRVVVTERLDEPNETGTVAYGYVEFRGERFTYREVDWSDAMVREACVKANLLGGEWDFEVLEDSFNRFDLVEWGFDPMEFPDEEESTTTTTADGRELVHIADDVTSSEPIYRLKVGHRRIPLTEDEWGRLERYCDRWAEEHGTYYGLFHSLLGGR